MNDEKNFNEIQNKINDLAQKVKNAGNIISNLSTQQKNKVLQSIADALRKNQKNILNENKKDLIAAEKSAMKGAFVERLTLNEKRIIAMAEGVEQIIKLPDPIGEIISGWKRPNGLLITKVRVPVGVVGIIYESRPNVTVDVAALCLKAGCVSLLRGGKEAFNSNNILTSIMQQALKENNLPEHSIELIQNTSRDSAKVMMTLNKYLDILIPRGGAGLIQTVVQNATVPVIETGTGNCHIFIDESADLNQSVEIVFNAKVQRPSVCNAVETILVHKNIAKKVLPLLEKKLSSAKVELRGCQQTQKIIKVKLATEDDWFTEFLDLILAIKIVSSLDEAINHINKYSSHHTESILTKDLNNAKEFTQKVDSSTVFVNASTRFTDGFEFGFGAEIGISTQKLHARGPMGLEALTTIKYVVWGEGQIRQ